jgi:hypothetical protein
MPTDLPTADDSSGAASPDDIRLVREMGITHAEFLRTFGCAMEQPYTIEGNTIILDGGERQVRINLAPQRERALGSVRLPVTEVGFQFAGYTRDEVERFMTRLDVYFHRGGG